MLSIFLFIANSFAGWERTYGGDENDEAYSVIQTSDGGYILTAKGAYSIIRVDSWGEIIWTRPDSGCYNARFNSVIQTFDGSYILVGAITTVLRDLYIIKIDEFGDTIWTRKYGGSGEDCGSSIIQTSDSGFIVTGKTNSFGAGEYDIWILRLDAHGDTIWTRTFGGSNSESAGFVNKSSDGGFLVLGLVIIGIEMPEYSYPYLIKMNETGDTLWSRIYSDRDIASGSSIAELDDGGFIIAGGCDHYKGYLLRVDSEGGFLWDTVYYSWPMLVTSMTLASDDGFAMTGEITLWDRPRSDVYLFKTDNEGNILWERIYGDYEAPDIAYSISSTNDGGFIIAGRRGHGSGVSYDTDVYLIKTDSLGNVDWIREPGRKPQNISLNVYPNPFNSGVRFQVSGVREQEIEIEIYDLRGNLIETFDKTPCVWQPDDEIGSGIYLVRARTEEKTTTKRIVLIR